MVERDEPSALSEALVGAPEFRNLPDKLSMTNIPGHNNQWLALAQGTLNWNDQRILFTVPRWLILNNEINISYGVIKEMIAAGYSTMVLVGVAVGAYQLQERAKRADQPKPVVVSSYGRPVVKGDR